MNIGGNMMAAFQQGAGTGQGIYRNKQRGEVNKLAAMGNLSGAAQKATEYGFRDQAQDFNQQIAQLDAQQRKAAADTAKAFGQIAGAALPLPEPQRAQFAAQELSIRGLDPSIVRQVQSWDNASLTAIRNASLDAAAQLAQANNVRDYKLKAEDTRADNARELMNTESLVADREADNIRGDQTLAETVRLNDSTIEDRGADNARADRLASSTIANTQSQIEKRAAEIDKIVKEANDPRAGKPFNQAQSQAAGYAERAAAASANFEKALAEGFDPTVPGGRNLPWVGGAVSSQQARAADVAKREFINAVLRRESGAAIGKDEFKNAEATYFPRVGDSPDVLEAKRMARQRAIDGMIAESQGAHAALFGGAAAPAPQPTDAPPARRRWDAEAGTFVAMGG